MKLIDLLVKELPKRGGWPIKVTSIGQDYDRELMFYGRGKPRTGIILNELAVDHRKCGDSDKGVTRSQYEAALAKNDGWIEWGGGECPVDLHSMLDVKYLGGGINTNVKAGGQVWYHTRHFGDIIAYRPHRGINSRANDDRLERDLNECIGQDVDVPEWNGEDLPPIGVKCEFTHGPYSVEAGELTGIIPKVGEVVEIVAHRLTSDNNPVAVVYWDDNGAGRSACFVEECFRPPRTEGEKAREKLAASLHAAAGASPIELNGIGPLYFKLADAIISGSVFGTTFKAGK